MARIFKVIRWLLGIPPPLDPEPQLGVLIKLWPDEHWVTYVDREPPQTDEELVMDAVWQTARHIAAVNLYRISISEKGE